MARPRRRLGNLPAEVTSFVGRRRELAEVRQKLAAARVVSLVGPGGVGKTRLAIRAADELQRGFRDGAWMVALAEVGDAALVPNAVMAALDLSDQAGVEPAALVVANLRMRELVLVIDNCEHLLGAVAELAGAIVATAPGVRIIATTREPLQVAGEHVIAVPPLELPSARGDEPLTRLRENEAVALFVQRAAAASGSFELTDANRSAVADLCRRLDGLPLALELAAVRTRVLSPEQVLTRLADRFQLLAGAGRGALPRHQTLETAIDWSHELLAEPERSLLRRLCVFAGRFTLADVEGICVRDGDALDLMSSLVDKSLVVKEDVRGVACYRLHETMREYAAGKLAEAGETELLERRCTDHYVMTCQAQVPGARFRMLDWLAEMDLEIDNLRSVLRRCVVQRDHVSGLVLATSLGWYWVTRALGEGVRWFDELLTSPEGTFDTLSWAYFVRGFLGVLQNDWKAAVPVLEKAVGTARDGDLAIQLANSLSMASIAANFAGDHAAAVRLLSECASVAERVEDVPTRVAVLQARSLNGMFEGDPEAVRIAATEGARLSREVGDVYSLHMMLLNLGGAALFAGDMAESRAHHEEALRLSFEIDDRIALFYLVAAFGFHIAMAGRPRVAAQLLGASETIRLGTGATVMATIAPFIGQAEETAMAALGEAKFRAEFDAGRALTREAAVRLALSDKDARELPATAKGEALPARQLEVARLVAEGLSNRRIAQRLFLSERTVDSHVRTILDRLGFNSRAQIAAWVVSTERR